MVLGSLGGQLADEPKHWFALGAVECLFPVVLAGLALLAAASPRLRTAKAQRIVNFVVGVVMWFIAFQLAKRASGVLHRVAELGDLMMDFH
ncbi:LysE family transporter [Shigella flexneri]